MAGRELWLLHNLPKVETVHKVGSLADGNGSRHFTLWKIKVVHAARVIVVLVADENHSCAIDIEGRTGQQGEPALPCVCYSCGLQLDRDATGMLNNLSELQNALSLIGKVERKMEIDDGGMLTELDKNIRGNLSLPGNLEGFRDVRVGWTKL